MDSKIRFFLHKSLVLEQTKQVHAQLLLNRHNHLEPILIHQTLHSTKAFSRNTVTYLKRIILKGLHTSKPSSTFSWGCLVRFLSQHRKFKEAVTSYIEMNNSGVPPSSHAVTSALRSCGKIESVIYGSSVHAQAVKNGLCGCVYVQTGLVGLYSKLGCVELAKKAFDEVLDKNIVSWNSLLHGYLESGELEEARRVFDEVPEKDVISWNLIISNYAKGGDMSNACSLFRAMPLKSSASWNILIGGYVNCGEMELARAYFDAMLDKNSVSWITMISGYTRSGDVDSAEEVFRQMWKMDKLVYDAMIACYAQNGKGEEAMKLFSRMLEANSGVQVDEITLSSVVSASSQLGDTSFGAWVESYITERGIRIDDLLSTSLIDLYMKGGEFDKAFKLFNGVNKKDTVSYSAMIMGCGINGLATEANRLFREMIEKKVLPNEVTFTGLLSACSHSGCVQDGYKCFDSMREYNVEPSADHYGVMVDMLGRAGRLEEAYEVIKSMPVKPNVGVWGALLLASGLHNNVEFGEIACRHCVELESDPSGYLSHLANIYTCVGRWEDARSVRGKMVEKKLRKTLGCSWVEGSNH
ncbi:Pentatricopeptide repeat-containing protein [Hirschfeldia incana]|nr:Pentatricopeptide repeat-containing protein [Hirschfeldia incana]KAJ0239549.1 Pentatricopeptide repeat-containing protein [Hirschfeldia incana]